MALKKMTAMLTSTAAALVLLAACGGEKETPTAATPSQSDATPEAAPVAEMTDAEKLTAIVDGRSDDDKARDVWRNPGETLSFFWRSV